jgi:hypothetical protein
MTPEQLAESRARRADLEALIVIVHAVATTSRPEGGAYLSPFARAALARCRSNLAIALVQLLDAPVL